MPYGISKRLLGRIAVGSLAMAGLLLLGAPTARAQDLIVDGVEIQMSGLHWYDTVQVINGGIIRVVAYDNGADKVNFGNLQLVANTIFIDATSGITADGAGYLPVFCEAGAGPNADSGGRGGCSVLDSGGGGAHFGRGGRGTRDVPAGEFHSPHPGLTCDFTLSQAVSTVLLPTIGFRCCSDTAP